jgi:glycosyltransferase involved in cell wall biosynthesis
MSDLRAYVYRGAQLAPDRRHPPSPASGRARAALNRFISGVLEEGQPFVSCVMPTRDRPEFAALAIRCFLRQDYPAKELIVLDDGNVPLPVTWGKDAPVRLLRVGRCTIGEKRNLGCRESRGTIVMHWDDDDWYGAGRIRRQIEPLLARRAEISGLVLTPIFDLRRFEFWLPSASSFARMHFAGIHCGTLTYWREVSDRFTRYPHISLGEDVGFLRVAMFAGCRLAGVAADQDFVYVRHGRNTWDAGQTFRQLGSRQIAPPQALIPDLAHYRHLRAQSLRAV